MFSSQFFPGGSIRTIRYITQWLRKHFICCRIKIPVKVWWKTNYFRLTTIMASFFNHPVLRAEDDDCVIMVSKTLTANYPMARLRISQRNNVCKYGFQSFHMTCFENHRFDPRMQKHSLMIDCVEGSYGNPRFAQRRFRTFRTTTTVAIALLWITNQRSYCRWPIFTWS